MIRVSNLARAKETADIIHESMDLGNNYDGGIVSRAEPDPLLNEGRYVPNDDTPFVEITILAILQTLSLPAKGHLLFMCAPIPSPGLAITSQAASLGLP